MGGNNMSTLVEAEKVSWVLPHKLGINRVLANSQIRSISNFGEILYLCYQQRNLYGQNYQHWFVTDRRWTIEFGGGDLSNNTVIVHNNPKGQYIEAETFRMTSDVRRRMEKVCGTTNYSLALRNCEHVARYIFCGVWACFQMTGDGGLRKIFFDYMKQYNKLINTYPEELMPKPEKMITLHKGITDFIRDPVDKKALTAVEDKMFNILFLGPTGCGKSTMINEMFNTNVCKAECGIDSVTKQINYIQGTYSSPFRMHIDGLWIQNSNFKVNVIDTIGFCDSVLTSAQVLSLVRNSVKVNLAHLDKVIVCCSGRLEAEHKNSIKQFMDWLDYKNNKEHFGFFSTKSDTMTEDQKQHSLIRLCDSLEIDSKNELIETLHNGRQIEMKPVNAIAFPPYATSTEVAINRQKLMRIAMVPPSIKVGSGHRIQVKESSCVIL